MILVLDRDVHCSDRYAVHTWRCSSFALLAYCFDSAVSVLDICVIPAAAKDTISRCASRCLHKKLASGSRAQLALATQPS